MSSIRLIAVSGVCLACLIAWPVSLCAEEVKTSEKALTKEASSEEATGWGITGFYNVREANPDTKKGEWQFEMGSGWVTQSNHTDDDVSLAPNLRYGVTDDMYLQLSLLPLNLGDGDNQGNGDISMTIFNRFIREDGALPAVAGWGEMRVPSGDGSSGVDGTFHLNLTKTILTNLRGNLEGFVETANGGRGDQDVGRRNFQWGVGPGLEYKFLEGTIGTMNYLNRSSDQNGNANQNILEFGLHQKLTDHQYLRVAMDVGLDGRDTTPNFATRFQWGISW
jgi:hypothetical protein